MANSFDLNYMRTVKAIPVDQGSSFTDNYCVDYIDSKKEEATEEQKKELIAQQGFTLGLCEALTMNAFVFPYRVWVIDNSGSMNRPDGHLIIKTRHRDSVITTECTRWEEIKECVNYHSHMAALFHAPTTFRLLNNPGALVGPQRLGIAERSKELCEEDLRNIRSWINKVKPSGTTPLTDHIIEIQRSVRSMAPQLQKEGKKAVIVLATDGLPTDERGMAGIDANNDFVQALRSLEGLPVWIVIRLCTDEDDIVSFYNDLDDQLELSLEVLDDFFAEAKEVYEFNKWLNYALPLHRMRELGFYDRVFDLIDERPLTKSEIREFCILLFGQANFDGVPDPLLDPIGFIADIERLMTEEKLQYHPIKKKMLPWIDTKALSIAFGGSAGCQCVIL